MPNFKIILNGDNCWPDLIEKAEQGKLIHYTGSISAAALPGGMVSGKPSIALRFDLEDGTVLVAETPMRLFVTAARVFVARFGEP